ncbi:hypothetical protein Vretimale_18358 [Volvox reticuliferus]|uniref:Uncharacterized protein n=1 Tax=Volvox reticuliferus TaxID=1737510 RepID=A0A8J4CBX5_9CHLO|nr:hypothetical protein Vretifemale_8802 [Volvox reticuliferus]GIM15592.1 hypothetical protein Vretimale_18358 [Volvox reticuliferus]
MAGSSIITVQTGLRCEHLHNLPIKLVNNTTSAKLEEKWTQSHAEGSDQAYLRGRLLRGTRVSLPEGYRGLVISSNGSYASSDECQRQWTTFSEFSSFTLWAHDVAPELSDPLRRALEWCALSNLVHTAITLEETEKELQSIISMTASIPQ